MLDPDMLSLPGRAVNCPGCDYVIDGGFVPIETSSDGTFYNRCLNCGTCWLSKEPLGG